VAPTTDRLLPAPPAGPGGGTGPQAAGASFLDLALRQRAHHRFDPQAPVPDADVMAMLTVATHAPSALNTQPWQFVVVRSAEVRRAFGAATRERWRASTGAAREKNLVPGSVFSELDDGNGNGGLETAPVVIIVCFDTTKIEPVHRASSIYPAVQNLLLAAAALGYGSCLTTGLVDGSGALVRELLELPDRLELMAAVFVGRPARTLGAPRRHPAETCTYREVFGSPW
jgi:nitroreductase